MNTEIKLVQSPVITHMLAKVGTSVTERIALLNIDAQVATEETIKALKELRAELNKELDEYESQRKAIKEGVLNPYNEFEGLYKTEVSEKYKTAIDKLKDKIAQVENKMRDERRESLTSYFDELCASEKIDFLTFDRLNIKINLSDSLKSYKDRINEVVSKVVDDLSLIDTHLHKAEVMVEYRNTLNVAKSIKDVTDRKEKERVEKERLRVIETNRRIDAVKRLGMTYLDMTNAYEFDAEIYITAEQLKTLSHEDFNTRLVELQEAIKAKKGAVKTPEQPDKQPDKPISAPLQAPVVEKPAELRSASFEVVGTMEQLRALGQYMRDHNIQYKNI